MAIVIGTGSFLLFFSLAVNIVAILVPYWIHHKAALGIVDNSFGLWGSCKCSWYYNDIKDVADDNSLKDWFKATQWLYAVAVILMGIALLAIFIVSCCSEKAYAKAMTAAGAIMLIAAVLIGVAVVIFGVKGHDDAGYGLDYPKKIIWGMWLAVAGFGVALITAIVFLIQGSRI